MGYWAMDDRPLQILGLSLFLIAFAIAVAFFF
jgi:hypothetical protein